MHLSWPSISNVTNKPETMSVVNFFIFYFIYLFFLMVKVSFYTFLDYVKEPHHFRYNIWAPLTELNLLVVVNRVLRFEICIIQ